MQRYWRFQLATIGVTVLSGSVSHSLKTIVDHPTSILLQLGQSLPQVAVYFLVTILSSALVRKLTTPPQRAPAAARITGRRGAWAACRRGLLGLP
eukprot:CAMPEP_0180522946 /NCGR_PEP_ID=MMETSP1036_2-20121128/57720_1 /TAXON_ID=632150 /ORGANISM="Azadinium spinosum, Strain 3D9" /LENGTH=94 /DNA_ID=CAMNT_0022535841 /DNA_START=229 /DNA_END=510 /DNA_ORIENTATION=-